MTQPREVAFPILGRPFTARDAPAPLVRWLRAFWHYPAPAGPPHPYPIALETVASRPVDAPGPWQARDVAMPGRALRFRTAGDAWEAGAGGAGVRLDLGQDGARIRVWGGAGLEDADLYHGLYVVLTEALRASGLLPLHAAAARRGDVTMAWLGASGIGKSTTLLFAAAAGWSPIAEDLCWLEPATLRVDGWDRGVRCRPETLQRFFPGWNDGEMASDGKRLVGYARLGGSADGMRGGTLNHLAVLGRDAAGPTRRESVASRDVVKALWEATGVPLSDWARQLSATAVARLSRLPAERLVLGDTPPFPARQAGVPADQAPGG